MKEVWLNLGSGCWLRKGFINLDVYEEKDLRGGKDMFQLTKIEEGAKYIQGDIRDLPFDDNYADYVEMMDVIEHFPMFEVVPAMREVCRVMKKGAKMVMTTINMDALALNWLNMVRRCRPDFKEYYEISQGIYGNQLSTSEYHRSAFNPGILDATLGASGFDHWEMYLLPRGSDAPTVGTIVRESSDHMMRYEILVAEVVK